MPKEEIYFDITPIGKPRMTQRDKWKHRPVVDAYYEYKDGIRAFSLKYKYTLEPEIDLTFYIPMPPSWSNKRREEMHLKPHQQKPDIDNLIKAFCDAMTDDDAGVWRVTAAKYWAEKGGILVR